MLSVYTAEPMMAELRRYSIETWGEGGGGRDLIQPLWTNRVDPNPDSFSRCGDATREGRAMGPQSAGNRDCCGGEMRRLEIVAECPPQWLIPGCGMREKGGRVGRGGGGGR